MRTFSFGLIGDHAVFMDERTDSYFTLDVAHERHLRRLLKRGEPLEKDAVLLEALGATGEDVDVLRAGCQSPSRSVVEQDGPGRVGVAAILKVASLVGSTRSRLRRLPIESTLTGILESSDRLTGELACEHATVEASRRFLKARKLVPIAGNCLLDSLSLLRWLGPCDPLALIFGAKLDPFAAHCWVQAGDLLLNDRMETVAAFTPVRVIRCSETTR